MSQCYFIGTNSLCLVIHASVNWVNIGLGNGLLPVRQQTIAWNNADL